MISVTPVKSIFSGSICRYSMPTRLASHSVSASSVRGEVLPAVFGLRHFWSATITSGCIVPR